MIALIDGRVVKMCRECNARRACRPRELCWGCYKDLDIRAQYETNQVSGRRGVGHVGTGRKPIPTDALPGTPEKLAVLEMRAAMGLQLFHEDDAGSSGIARGVVEFMLREVRLPLKIKARFSRRGF